MRVVVQLVNDGEDDYGLYSKVVAEGYFKLADSAEDPIMTTNSDYQLRLECDRAALEASASLLLALHPELREIRRQHLAAQVPE